MDSYIYQVPYNKRQDIAKLFLMDLLFERPLFALLQALSIYPWCWYQYVTNEFFCPWSSFCSWSCQRLMKTPAFLVVINVNHKCSLLALPFDVSMWLLCFGSIEKVCDRYLSCFGSDSMQCIIIFLTVYYGDRESGPNCSSLIGFR